MDKAKIMYEKAIISRDNVARINFDKRYVDIEGRRINSDQPQMSLISTFVVFIINVSEGIIGSLLASKIEKLWNGRNKNKILKKLDATGKMQSLKPSFKLCNNQGTEITIIVSGDLMQTQIINIFEILRHLKNDRYIFMLAEDGTIKIYTELEYAQSKHDLQNG